MDFTRDYISQNYEQKVRFYKCKLKKCIYASKTSCYVIKIISNNWLAHDYLHMRQIIKYQYLKEKTNIDLQYAGNW